MHDVKRLPEAVASFDKAIALKQDHADAYNNRGRALQDLRRPDEALASFAKAIALTPDNAPTYSYQSLCLLQMGRFQQGWPLYEWRKKLEEPFGNRLLAAPLAWPRRYFGQDRVRSLGAGTGRYDPVHPIR